MAVLRPHQAVYWQVALDNDPDRRGEIRSWCRTNISPSPRGPAWIAPREPHPDEVWWSPAEAREIWHLRRYEDAVMFDMVWS